MQIVITVRDGATAKDIAGTLRFQAGCIEGMEPTKASSRANTESKPETKVKKGKKAQVEETEEEAGEESEEEAGEESEEEAGEESEEEAGEESEEEAGEESEEEAGEESEEEITKDQVIAACQKASKKIGRDGVVKILLKFNKAGDVNKVKSEQYADLIKKLGVK